MASNARDDLSALAVDTVFERPNDAVAVANLST
jgi:hypothetical protein